MLETMLTAGGTGKHYPNSGPGPQTLLFGDTEEGYFGRVPAGEMIALTDITAQVGVAISGTLTQWLKFYRKNEVIFIGVGLGISGSWTASYNAGIIYGTDDDGMFPLTPGVNQLRVLRQGKWGYILRAMRLSDDSTGKVAVTTPVAEAGEYATFRKAIHGSYYGTGVWDTVAAQITGTVRERNQANTASSCLISNGAISAGSPSNSGSQMLLLALTSLEGRVLPTAYMRGELGGIAPVSPTVTIDPAVALPVTEMVTALSPVPTISPTVGFTSSLKPVDIMTGATPSNIVTSPVVTFTPNEE